MIDLFQRQRKCLRTMGHILVHDKSEYSGTWRKFLHFCIITFVISGQWPITNNVIYNIDNVDLATASLSIFFTNMLSVIKIATFLCYKSRFIAMMTKLENMYKQSKGCDAKRILEADNQKAFLIVKLYYMSVCTTALYFMVFPLLKIVWSKIRNTQIVLELPMPMRFVFDTESSPGYQFAYIYIGLVTIIVVMYSVATDGLFVSLAVNLVSHLKILQNSIQENNFLKTDWELLHDLKTYVQYHNLLLTLCNELCNIYTPIIFGQFLMTSLQLCVILFQMVKHLDSILILIVNCTFLTSILMQLFIYCYSGEIIKFESSMIGISVQLSNWYNLKPTYRRMLMLLMLRSQRDMIIKAGFYEASLANFMVILQAAVSYITILKSIE